MSRFILAQDERNDQDIRKSIPHLLTIEDIFLVSSRVNATLTHINTNLGRFIY